MGGTINGAQQAKDAGQGDKPSANAIMDYNPAKAAGGQGREAKPPRPRRSRSARARCLMSARRSLEFQIPPYKGERYTEKVPDTLDLAERARLAIHGLTGFTDPDADYMVYSFSGLYRNPPTFIHQYGDVAGLKFNEALPLMRLITGSTENEHVDRAWMDVTLKSIGDDGLYWWSH